MPYTPQLTEDEIHVLADQRSGIALSEGRRSDQIFILLVDVAIAYVKALQLDHRPNLDDPDSFRLHTLGGVDYREAALGGLADYLYDPDLAGSDL